MTSASQGLLLGLGCGIVSVAGLLMFPGSEPIAIIVLLIFPFSFCYLITSNFTMSATLVWLNELLFGASGTWMAIGPIPGRGLLLLLAVGSVFFSKTSMRYLTPISKRTNQIIVFYSVAFPIFLVTWSILVKGAQIGDALGDVLRFAGILGFYPAYYLFRTNFKLASMWLITAVTLLSLFFIIGSIGPDEIKRLLVDNWVNLGKNPDKKINYLRLSYETLIYGYIGFFYGLILITRIGKNSPLGMALILINLTTTLVNFLRGPLLALALTMLFFFITVGRSPMAIQRLAKLLPGLIAIVLLAGFFLKDNAVALKKMDDVRYAGAIEDVVNDVRVDQTIAMLETWKTAPILGAGVGTKLTNYYKGTGLSVEFQYMMVLYRTGVVGLIIVVTPFFFILMYLFRQKITPHMDPREVQILYLQKSVGLATIALGISSFFNPYLASSVAVTFMVLFFALTELHKQFNNWSQQNGA